MQLLITVIVALIMAFTEHFKVLKNVKSKNKFSANVLNEYLCAVTK